MQLKIPAVSFADDSRGVSGVVGFILIFAIIMILLSINQSQVVPQENKEIEFQHYQDVRDDMVEVRSGVSEAAEEGTAQYPTVKLGTNYPTRVLGINPPPPSGQLSTTTPYNITFRNEGRVAENISTRFYEYQNGYNYMEMGSIWLESTGVLYLDARSKSGEIVTIEDQNLIVGDGQAHINILKGDYSESGTKEVTIEIYPTKNASVTPNDLSGNVTIEIPTRLNGTEYWNKTLVSKESATVVEKYYGTHSFQDIHQLKFTVKAENIDITTLGTGSAPPTKGSASSEEEYIWRPLGGPLVYTDSNGNLFSIKNGSSRTDYNYFAAKVIGPKSVNLDEDGAIEIPVVNGNGELEFVDSNGPVTNPPNNAQNPQSSKSLMAVGVWDGSATSVFYAGKNNKIYRATKTTQKEVNPLNGQAKADAVLGIADIDGDGSKELIYGGKGDGGNSNTVNYIDSPDGGIGHISNSQYGTNNAPGVGTPADFDGDGKSVVPIVDGSNNIKLLDSDGVVKTITVSSATKAPITTRDVDGDEKLEIVYLRSSKLKYIDEVGTPNPTSHFIRNEVGDKVQASGKRGVA